MSEQSNQPHAVLAAPVAPRTWEVKAQLLRTVRETGKVTVNFRRAVEIVGLRPVVVPVRPFADDPLSDPTTIPTLDDIECFIDVNQEKRLTNRADNAAGTGDGDSYVTLSHLSIEVPRLLRYSLGGKGTAPDMTFQFRWKQNDVNAPYFESALIGVALMIRDLED